ncbi:hypothetical protein CC1G_11345 [Coprinopsis cinerea okayama7|uniref:Uncharacterized protein n=1 Tax=Coprinopsis cinerea (strain Okayama-7 / 130 / ATCC MYA-4618 / FGSC 9003) TaxID=240176 RepID=A8P8U2_COPC7|nr:hypothetical protein CC1G_11345 [Coprinopsis cinerea okayama7\|eukprot:XP_001839634.1 hypothetical protein CC1G_11345 [Coprinopsis cinerea okayama7\
MFSLPNRPDCLPRIEKVNAHPLVSGKSGPVYIVHGTSNRDKCKTLLQSLRSVKIPKSSNEARKNGWLILDPDDDPRVIWTDDDRGAPDCMKLWFLSKKDCTPEEVQGAEQLVQEIVGDVDENGLTQYERDPRCSSSGKGGRCYSLSTTHQDNKDIEAPFKGRKCFGRPLDGHDKITKKLLEFTSYRSMQCLEKGPAAFVNNIKSRSEMVNLPRIGHESNTAFPAFQLNIATAEMPGQTNETGGLRELGTAGEVHGDIKDCVGGISAITCYSEDRQDVEEDVLYFLELGVGFILRRLVTACFSGMNLHRGSAVQFKQSAGNHPRRHFRIVAVGYPPMHHLEASSSSALAMVPSTKREGGGEEHPKGSKHVTTEVLKLFKEMKQFRIPDFPAYRPEAQATYLSQSRAISTAMSYGNHASRSIVTLVSYLISQVDPSLQMRFDRDRLLSSFSWVVPNEEMGEAGGYVRVCADPWTTGPGWTGDDVRIGKKYEDTFDAMSYEELVLKRNTDAGGTVPYGNQTAAAVDSAWNRQLDDMTPTFPVCVLSGETEGQGRGAAQRRKGTIRRLTNFMRQVDAVVEQDEPEGQQLEGTPEQDDRVALRSSTRIRVAPHTQDTIVTRSPLTKRKREPSRGKAPRKKGRSDVACSSDRDEREGEGTGDEDEVTQFEGLLSTFTLDSLQRHRVEAMDIVEHLHSTPPNISSNMFDDLPGKVTELCGTGRVHELWGMSAALEKRHSASVLDLVEERSNIMAINMLAWEWLDGSLENGLKVRGSANNTHWTAQLFRAIENIHLTPDMPKTLKATICFPTMVDAPDFVHQPLLRRRYSPMTREKLKDKAADIVRTWFSYPKNEYHRVAAQFTRKLVDASGPFVLLYPPVWDAYTNLRRGMAISSRATVGEVERWAREELRRASFTRKGSAERKLLRFVCSLYGQASPLLDESSLDVVL